MPPKGGDYQLDDTAFGDSRRRRPSKTATEHEYEYAIMSGRRDSDHGGKRQPRRRASEDKTRAAREDDDDGEVPATLSFIPPKNEKVCSISALFIHLSRVHFCFSSVFVTQGAIAKHHFGRVESSHHFH